MRAWPALLVVLFLHSAQASTTMTWPASVHTIALIADASIPIFLAAGAAGGTVLNTHKTGASSSVNGGVVATTFHTATAQNRATSAARINLTLRTTAGPLSECARCDIELRSGSTSIAQIRVTAGSLTQSQGALVAITEAGGSQPTLQIRAIAQRTGLLADKTVWLNFTMQIVPSSGLSPSAHYGNMSIAFVV